jgi:hypothetical protein
MASPGKYVMAQKRKARSSKPVEDAVRGMPLDDRRALWESVNALRAFYELDENTRVAKSARTILDTVINATKPPDEFFALAIIQSESLLSGYATLDETHRQQIKSLILKISEYLRDATRKRPLNALMLASPGAGKSHFIKQLAVAMTEERVRAVTFNMATMQSTDDMAQPVDELRNLKVNDQRALLFLDEFDSDPSRYATLLPLLWDGELQVGHRDLKVGKAVIVLAGSSPDLPKVLDHSATMKLEADSAGERVPTGKLLDLLSRVNGGVIEIPDLDLHTQERDRRVDKVCITTGLLKARFGSSLQRIPRSLLRFVAHTKFRYGVRSIAHLIDLIDSEALTKGALKIGRNELDLKSEQSLKESSLRFHLLDKDRDLALLIAGSNTPTIMR